MDSRTGYPGHTREELAEPRVAENQVYYQQMTVRSPSDRTEMIQETYRLLAVAVFCAMASAYFASKSVGLISLLLTTPGLIISLLMINLIPHLARRAMGKSRFAGITVLALDGILCGVVISPLVFVALLYSGAGEDTPNLVQGALVITGSVFAGLTAYVHMAKKNFNWGGGIFAGVFFTAIGLGLLSWLVPGIGGLHYLILGVVGILGVLQLLYGTSKVLNDPEFQDPVSGALILFAGLFNLFQVILNLLLSGGRSRD